MTTEVSSEESPNEALAALIIAKLKEKGFVADGKDAEIFTKLNAGTASREDWTLWVDLAQSKKSKDGKNGKN